MNQLKFWLKFGGESAYVIRCWGLPDKVENTSFDPVRLQSWMSPFCCSAHYLSHRRRRRLRWPATTSVLSARQHSLALSMSLDTCVPVSISPSPLLRLNSTHAPPVHNTTTPSSIASRIHSSLHRPRSSQTLLCRGLFISPPTFPILHLPSQFKTLFELGPPNQGHMLIHSLVCLRYRRPPIQMPALRRPIRSKVRLLFLSSFLLRSLNLHLMSSVICFRDTSTSAMQATNLP